VQGGSYSNGTVFELDKTGKETVLYSFAGGTDGASPFGSLVRDSAGNLYGTTYYGGASGMGAVFELDNTGHETVLYSFAGGPDGVYPAAGLVRDAKGNLYGTTFNGGGRGNEGVVFKVSKVGKETVLYRFAANRDGANPYLADLVRDANGNLYGVTNRGGGTGCGGSGCGVVFKISAPGKESVLYSFTGGKDGALPLAGLLRDNAGHLYGTVSGGGDSECGVTGGCGVAFEITP